MKGYQGGFVPDGVSIVLLLVEMFDFSMGDDLLTSERRGLLPILVFLSRNDGGVH
jgi:hypothetical protein